MIRAVIVDDERLARVELKRLLAAHAEIEVVSEAANINEAERVIEATHPDLIFLDVQMPGGSGFDLLERLDWLPNVIFTTAFDAYALKAFEVNALDYLQKPIEPKRMAAALDRAIAQYKKSASPAPQSSQSPKPKRTDEKIFIKDGERCWFVALADIMLFESEGNYARVYFQSDRETQRPLMLRSLNQLEERLDTSQFFRANRRQIVNLNFIGNVEATESGGLAITMKNNLRIELSRRRAAAFKDISSL